MHPAAVDLAALFRDAFHEAGTGMAVTLAAGDLVAANASLCRLVGRDELALRRLGSEALIHPEDRPGVAKARAHLVSGASRHVRSEHRYLRADGSLVWVREDLTRVEDRTGTLLYLLSHVEDLTGWRQLQDDAARQAEMLDLVQKVALAANSCPDSAPVVAVAVDAVCAVTGWRAGRLWTRSSERGWVAQPWREPGTGLESLSVSRLAQWSAEPPLPERVDESCSLVWAGPDESGHAGSRIGVPIVSAGGAVALLEFASDTPGAPDPRLAPVMSSVGRQVGYVFERETARRSLRASEELARLVIDRANDAYVQCDVDNRITAWNPQAERTFGWAAAEVVGRSLSEVLIPMAQRQAHARAFARMLATGESRLDGRRLQVSALHRDGHEFPVELSLSARREGSSWHVHGFLHDISQRVAAEREIARQTAFLDTVLDSLVDGVAACDADGRLVLVNDSLRRRLGLRMQFQPPEHWREELLMFEDDGVTPIAWDASPLYRAFRGETVTGQRILEGANRGSLRRMVVQARPLRDAHGQPVGAVATYHDVTEQSRAALALSRWTRHDHLTGLPNAVWLREHLELAEREPRGSQLLLIAVDDYRATVATDGQQAGEALLREVASRLAQMVRDGDVVAHIEVDQFGVLVEDGGRLVVAPVAERVTRAFAAPWSSPGKRQLISLSTGLAAGAACLALLRNAELALANARAQGRGRLEVFRPEMESALRDELALKEDLDRALQAGEFALRYQPQVDLRTGTVRGVEALVRWQHPTRGMVRPDEFIPLAEQTGLIVPLGRWVLGEACAQLRSWRDAGLPDIRMAVNLSAGQLDERLVAEVAGVLAATGIPAALLELEITETAAVRPDSASLAVLNGLRDLGVTLSVDDFGTGYSMLGQLRAFPFTQLKIDKSFVQDLDEDGQAPLVVAMISMARALGLEVVAEGVETLEQLAFLHGEDCPLAQGYLFARPVEAPEIVRLMQSQEPLPGFATAVRASAAPVSRARQPLRSTAELELMARPLLEQVERATGLESTYLTRVEGGVQEVLAARNSGDIEIPEGLRLPWSETLCSRALVDGAAIVTHVPVAFPGVDGVTELGIETYVGAPIRTADGALFGTLCGASASALTPNPAVLDMLTLYADLLGERISREALRAADEHTRLARRDEQDKRALFLREAEHRIREQLTVLSGWSDTLLRRGDQLGGSAHAQALLALSGSAAQVGRHVDRLLDEARGENLRQALELAPVPLRRQLDEALGSAPPAVTSRMELVDCPPVDVLVDRLALATTFGDVLRVAARGPAGSPITVSAQLIGTGVEVVVRACGAGLPADSDVFAPFTTEPADTAGEADAGSLYVARALVEAMGGTIVVGGRPGGELTLAVWLQVTGVPVDGH